MQLQLKRFHKIVMREKWREIGQATHFMVFRKSLAFTLVIDHAESCSLTVQNLFKKNLVGNKGFYLT